MSKTTHDQERADELLANITQIIGWRTIKSDPLCEAFDQLDRWLSAGGTLPRDWEHRHTFTPYDEDSDEDTVAAAS